VKNGPIRNGALIGTVENYFSVKMVKRCVREPFQSKMEKLIFWNSGY